MYVPAWEHFTTDSGEKLSLRGEPAPGVTPGRYDTSGMQVCVYMYPEDFPAERISAQLRDELIQKGFIEGRNGDECDRVIIPVDTITLPSGEKAYVLPSSIHELLLLPFSVQTPVSKLQEIVRAVNRSSVAEEEQLSDAVYLYSTEEDRLSLIPSSEEGDFPA